MIPVMLFVGGPADGWMLSSNKQAYAVGLKPADKDGWFECAIYYLYGTSPGYAGDLPAFMTTGCYLFKAYKDRPVSLIDGWMPDARDGNTDGSQTVEL